MMALTELTVVVRLGEVRWKKDGLSDLGGKSRPGWSRGNALGPTSAREVRTGSVAFWCSSIIATEARRAFTKKTVAHCARHPTRPVHVSRQTSHKPRVDAT